MEMPSIRAISDASLTRVKDTAQLLVARKANDHAKQQGDAAISLLKAAADVAKQAPTSSDGRVDLYA